jgi:NitT/TauT family transport system permease protein
VTATALEVPSDRDAHRLARLTTHLRDTTFSRGRRRALISYCSFVAMWQLGATSARWLGHAIPVLSNLPPPTAVVTAWAHLIFERGYWQSWLTSFVRVVGGFAAAVLAGVPFGLAMAMSRRFRGVAFPVFELLRPIPPLAWVPAAIIFWPTQELSIDFVIFLGAFYTIVLNVLGGADTMDERLIQVARSMGASRWNIFRRLVFRAVLPSILVGMDVSIGITWEVVVAAEMISGGGSAGAGASGGGLGFFIWSSYVGGSYPRIIVGMISIGLAGYLSSATLRRLAARFLPWLEAHA